MLASQAGRRRFESGRPLLKEVLCRTQFKRTFSSNGAARKGILLRNYGSWFVVSTLAGGGAVAMSVTAFSVSAPVNRTRCVGHGFPMDVRLMQDARFSKCASLLCHSPQS